ncbi:MAG: glycerol-3-phosphate dehydrogenase, partial [Curtobacterium sp.]
RISIEAWDRGESAAPVAAKLMADVLGWDQEITENEVSNYLKRVAAERESQLQPDDESADRVRLEAPDIAFGFDEDDVVVGGGRSSGADGAKASDEQVVGEKTSEPR